MHLRRAQQQLLAVIAILALTFAALSPAIAAASGKATPAMWVELCSAQGVKRIAIDTSGPSAPGDHAERLAEHCPFCHIEHTTTGLPPAASPVVPRVIGHAHVPARFYTAPRPQFSWAPTRSRAPPPAA